MSKVQKLVDTKQKQQQKKDQTQFGTRLFWGQAIWEKKLVCCCYENYSNLQQEQNGLI